MKHTVLMSVCDVYLPRNHQSYKSLSLHSRHVIVVGDFNCSIQPIDSAYAQDDPVSQNY